MIQDQRAFVSASVFATLLFAIAPVIADDPDPAHETEDSDELEEIVVRAHPLSEGGVSQSYRALSGDELAREAATSIGETLESLAGVRSASFGAGVGRPMIHGLGGVRVKTMMDRTSTLDMSKLITDHPVTVNPHMANLIEVVKGPSAMVYGSESIGGIINVETGRIPKSSPDGGWDGRIDTSMSDNSARQSFAGRFDLDLGNVVLHGDVDTRQADDYDIPGCTESEYLACAA